MRGAALRLVYVVTHPVTADKLLRGQLSFMRERGYEVTVIASPGEELGRVAVRERVRTIGIPMVRAIAPEADAIALLKLTSTLRGLRPDIVNASTPKAGLLGMLAARALRVACRVYLLRGLRLETTSGLLRGVLGTTERIASYCAHDVICVSRSLRDVAVRGGYVPDEKARVLGPGSSNGVELARFEATEERVREGARRTRALGIADDEAVVGFVGRLDPDKGIAELLDAFAVLRRARPRTRLLMIGLSLADDAHCELARRIAVADGVVVIPSETDLAALYTRMAVLAFPSFREGFPNVPLEAAAAGVPVVAFEATGSVDVVRDGTTGSVVPAGDVIAFRVALGRYLDDSELRRLHGAAACAHAAEFSQERVWGAWDRFYRERVVRGLRGEG